MLKLVSITFSKMLFLLIISSLFLPHSVVQKEDTCMQIILIGFCIFYII